MEENIIQKQIDGTSDVVSLIYAIINGEYQTRDHMRDIESSTPSVMNRQIQHLNWFLNNTAIQETGIDLTPYQKAVDDGTQWLQNNS